MIPTNEDTNYKDCAYRDCNNSFAVGWGNGQQRYCTPACQANEAAARKADILRRRTDRAARLKEVLRKNMLIGGRS